RPITLRNLMTHTGGFEEEAREIIIINPKKIPTLREFLIENQPRRLFPPGLVPGYSNYGVGLASYIVERASGEPFEQYVAEHIFLALGMTHSTFYQPLPKELGSLPSEGYRGNTEKPAVGFEIFNSAGAGGKVRPELVQMLSDRYFPSDRKQTFITVHLSELKTLEGSYQSTRRADSTKLRIGNLLSQRTATVDKDGVVQLEEAKDLRGHTIKWKPIGKDLMQQVDGQLRLFAIRDARGKVIRLAYDF